MVPVMPQVSTYTWIHERNIEEKINGYVVSKRDIHRESVTPPSTAPLKSRLDI
jgi:hypothetical protein